MAITAEKHKVGDFGWGILNGDCRLRSSNALGDLNERNRARAALQTVDLFLLISVGQRHNAEHSLLKPETASSSSRGVGITVLVSCPWRPCPSSAAVRFSVRVRTMITVNTQLPPPRLFSMETFVVFAKGGTLA
jgi:hypothetical protein